MALNYERIGWENAPSTNTPIDAGSLNHMDNGILAVSNLYDVDVPYLKEQVAGIPAMLDSYLADQIGVDVDKWLDDHVTPGGSTIVVDDTLTISGAAADSKTVGDALATKANTSDVNAALAAKADTEDLNQLENALSTKAEQDGAYPDLTAGQMLSKNEASDSVPYNFRAVGQDATLEYTDAIVGGTVAWNQLVQNGNFESASGWNYSNTNLSVANNEGTLTSTGVNPALSLYRSVTFVQGHKILVSLEAKGTVDRIRIRYPFQSLNKDITSSYTTYDFIGTVTDSESDNLNRFMIQPSMTNSEAGRTCVIKNINVHDLTKMFGTAIADFLYSLGSEVGVAWLRKRFPKMFTYQPYNAGEIVSVQGLSEHVTTGFNQWDEEWEVGNINASTGQNEAGSLIRSKNYIPVLPNTVYYANVGTGTVSNFVWYEYDADKNYLGQQKVVDNGHGMFTTSANAHYIKFRLTSGYGTTYNHDICINLSDPTRNGEYEPYVKHTYPLDNSLTLRGILKLTDSNGSGELLSIIDTINLHYDGDRYLPDGTVQRRYGIVDLGTLNYSYNSVVKTMVSTGLNSLAKFTGNASIAANIICSKYATLSLNIVNNDDGDGIALGGSSGLSVKDLDYTDTASFKTAMSGVYLVYELATPTTEEADPYTVPQIVDPDGTEEYVSTSIVPVGHESRYPLDIAGRLDKILTMPTANGTYTLRATVNNGAVTYAWVST